MTQQIFANHAAIAEKLEKMRGDHELELKRREFKDRQTRTSNMKASAKDASGNQDLTGTLEGSADQVKQ